jgi:hypothetical protein
MGGNMQQGKHRKTEIKGWHMLAIVVAIAAVVALNLFWPRPKSIPAADMITSPQVKAAQNRTFSKYVPMRVRLWRPVSRPKARPTPAPAPSPKPSQTQPWGPATAPQQIASSMLPDYGWDIGQMSCLVPLWTRESGWNVYADNPSSGAYGIPQALPAGKMASAGADWQTDAATQIRWGLGYIQATYGTPCGAWGHEEADGWY